MTRELVDKRKLRLNVVELEGAKQLDDHQPPVSAEQVYSAFLHPIFAVQSGVS